MQDEKDMIDINLDGNTSPTGKGITNYLGNIRFARSQRGCAATSSDVPYDEFAQAKSKSSTIKGVTVLGLELPLSTSQMTQIRCLRQMYCPDCQQRLDAQSVRYEKVKLLTCCPCFVPFSYVYSFACWKKQRQQLTTRKVYCKSCGANLGYWKCN